MKLVHKGSTKDVYSVNNKYLFKFSNRYSVFDWGEMPDHIPHKGEALALFAKKTYQDLENQGIKTHLIDEKVGADEMLLTPFEVIRDVKQMPVKENIFVPLEVIFRLGVAKGSSLLKRSSSYKEGDRFKEPMVEFTTKLERFDRPLDHKEAREISNLNDKEWTTLIETTHKIALRLNAIVSKLGIELWDGKVEYALGQFKNDAREIILVDTIGPDELRLTKNGVLLSKEIIRQFYRKSPWYTKLEEVKTTHGESFKDHIEAPAKLPEDFKVQVENLYTILAESITKEDSTRLDEVIENLRRVTL